MTIITKLLDIFEALKSLVSFIQQAVGLYQKAKKEGWLKEGQELAKRIENASSDEERRELLRKLVAHDQS